jgi:pyruvate kinase
MASEHVKTIVKKAGGTASVRSCLKVSAAAISNWKKVPAEHILKLAHLANMTPAEIRPDLAPNPERTP